VAAQPDRHLTTAALPSRFSSVTWRKSSASAGAGECVEVARSDSVVLARDSRNQSGTVLEFTPAQWLGFLRRVRNGDACRS